MVLFTKKDSPEDPQQIIWSQTVVDPPHISALILGRLDPGPVPVGQKWPTKIKSSDEISCLTITINGNDKILHAVL